MPKHELLVEFYDIGPCSFVFQTLKPVFELKVEIIFRLNHHKVVCKVLHSGKRLSNTGQAYENFIIEQFASNKSSLLLKIQKANTPAYLYGHKWQSNNDFFS